MLGLVGYFRQVSASENVGYDKGLYIKTDDDQFKMVFNIQMQPQHQFVLMEGQGDTPTFQIRRARFVFGGHAFDPRFTYKFQFEALSGRVTTTREGVDMTGPNLREGYVN